MSFHVTLAARAKCDINQLFSWLSDRSPDGANRWYSQLLARLETLANTADGCPLAPEAEELGLPLRQSLFKTRRGNLYRTLFVIEGQTVRILTVRGPGQTAVTLDDLAEP